MDAKVTTPLGIAQDFYSFGYREHSAIAHLMGETGVRRQTVIS